MVTAPDSTTTRYQYSATTAITSFGYNRLWQTRMIDANNHAVDHFTNSFGELVLARENTGSGTALAYADTRYQYNTVGNLIQVLTSQPGDTAGSTLRHITMTYDRLGRKTGMDDPDMGEWSYSYGPAGNLSQQVDGRGQILCFNYNTHNWLERKVGLSPSTTVCPTEGAALGSGQNHLATYTYNDAAVNGEGKVTKITWGANPGSNFETFDYDNEGRLISHLRKINGRDYTLATTSFDTLDRPLTVSYPGNDDLLLAYDHEGVDTLKFKAGSTTTNLITAVGYTALGQLAAVQREGAAPDTTYTYYPAGPVGKNFRLQKIQHGGANDVFADYNYNTYDPVGNLLSMTIDHSGTTSDVVHTYTYDDFNRLATAKAQVGTATPQYNYTYTYDKLGNIDQRTGTGGTWDYLYHGTIQQRLQQVTGYALHTTVYDGNGNLASYKIGTTQHTLVYDAENRLTSSNVGGQTTTFSYDASGQRIRTTYPNGTNIYTPFAEFDETVPASGTATQRSSYFLNGQLVAVRTVTGSTVAHYFTYADHLGNVSAMSTNGNNFVNNSYAQYKPFGGYQTEPTTNPTLTDRGFTGHRHNNTGTYDLGLIYMNARYYMPEIGRFISPDTIVPDPQTPQTYNRYSYSFNNPIKYTDPGGRCPICIVGIVALKAIDYGWTAWDTFQAGRTLANANASQDEKLMAGLTVGLSVVFEAIEPDDILPVGLPADDLARRALLKSAQEALDEGGPEALEALIRSNLGDQADTVLSKLDELTGISAPTWRGGLRNRMGNVPAGMANPQAHHNLPWKFREWFAQPGRGLDVNDPAFGRWVEGTPPGQHQNWTRHYEDAWTAWIGQNPQATRQQVSHFLQSLLDSGLYP